MNKEYKFIYKKIKEYDTIVIARHKNSDMDALGAQFALKEWINLNFEDKKVYCIGENHQKYTTKGFIPLSDSFEGDTPFLGICLDVNTIDRTAGDEVFKKATYKICIDHHHYTEKNEYDYICIEDTSCACCEILAKMLFSYKKKMNTQVCKYLYSGLSSDSGNFYYPSTTPSTLKVASKLMEVGNFNPYNEIHMIVGLKTLKDLELANYLFSKIVVDPDGFAYFENSIADLASLNITASAANEKIAEFNKVEEIKIFLAASECEDHTFRCSLRSKNISVVEVAQKYGGGGHNLACGIKSISKENLEKMKLELTKLTK